MNETAEGGVAAFGPWAPGVESPVPENLRHLCTIFRPENSTTSWASARELRDLTGLQASDLAAFRPQRLALHELLIRVTADYSVPDGPRIEDLGINFRRIASHSGQIDVTLPLFDMPHMALAFQDSEYRPDGGITGLSG